MEEHLGSWWWARLLFQRGLAAIYLLAFVSALQQFPALLGEHGLLPVPRWLAHVRFREAPSVFHFGYSDRRLRSLGWLGISLSTLALLGVTELGPNWASFVAWIVLWGSYLSIVNVGQTFYAFGWESMLLEAGFFAAFLGASPTAASPIPVLALRWMLFRTELGAGLIKLRHDPCWRNLTCLYYHHETQPLPNPLSWYFHRLPRWAHRAGVVFSHFVQLVAPFGLFLPQPIAAVAGLLIIAHQGLLILSGNYAWLNALTIVLGFTAFDDGVLRSWLDLQAPASQPRSLSNEVVLYVLALATLLLSVKPTANFFKKDQRMNFNYNPWHVVSSYGAFGSVTRERYEIILEGTSDDDEAGSDHHDTRWLEYGFKAKPGELSRRPPQIAPYHLRLDWLMWFLPLGSAHAHAHWFLAFVRKLLEGDPAIKKLLRVDPFPDRPPRRIRALVYLYRFTDREQRKASGAFWKRQLVDEFLPAVSATDLQRAARAR